MFELMLLFDVLFTLTNARLRKQTQQQTTHFSECWSKSRCASRVMPGGKPSFSSNAIAFLVVDTPGCNR